MYVNSNLYLKGSIQSSKITTSKELTTLKEENASLKELVETRDKRISLLEGQLKGKEQKYHNDLKLTQRNISELKSEIDAKSNTIAHLTTQLHQLKVRATKADDRTPGPVVPTPPRGRTPNTRSRPLRRSITSPTSRSISPGGTIGVASHQVDVSNLPIQSMVAITGKNLPSRPAQSMADPPRPALGHSAARREREIHLCSRPKPVDYKDFINSQQINNDRGIAPRVPQEPLPPISASRIGRQHAAQSMAHSKQKSDGKSMKRSGRGNEVTEVVVEPMGSPERTWRKMQDSKYKE